MGIIWIELKEMPDAQSLNDKGPLVWFLIGITLDLYFSVSVLLLYMFWPDWNDQVIQEKSHWKMKSSSRAKEANVRHQIYFVWSTMKHRVHLYHSALKFSILIGQNVFCYYCYWEIINFGVLRITRLRHHCITNYCSLTSHPSGVIFFTYFLPKSSFLNQCVLLFCLFKVLLQIFWILGCHTHDSTYCMITWPLLTSSAVT